MAGPLPKLPHLLLLHLLLLQSLHLSFSQLETITIPIDPNLAYAAAAPAAPPVNPNPQPALPVIPVEPVPTPTPTPTPFTGYRAMAREFVRYHNRVRSTIPKLPSVRWDRQIARHARWWSNQRRGDCALIHSGSEEYGENMFWGGAGFDWKAGDAVQNWAKEHLYYDHMSNSCEAGQMCGHFTQMVWNTTVSVGCGRAVCDDGGVIITCNYYPPGNWLGEKPF